MGEMSRPSRRNGAVYSNESNRFSSFDATAPIILAQRNIFAAVSFRSFAAIVSPSHVYDRVSRTPLFVAVQIAVRVLSDLFPVPGERNQDDRVFPVNE